MYELNAYPEFPNHIYASKSLWKSTYTEVWQMNVASFRGKIYGKKHTKINKFSYEYDFFNNRAEVNKNKN
jgi:hypothetical protein